MDELFFTQADWQLFTNLNTLPQQAGVSRLFLPKLLVKELTDNALDASDKVELYYQTAEPLDCLIIRDYGKGFGEDLVQIANIFSLKRPLTSSKRLRLPTRGALGNGLRVVMGAVYCLSGRLELLSQGRHLQLIPQDDGETQVEVLGDYSSEANEIRLYLPDNFLGEMALDWGEKALAINQGKVYTGKSNIFWYDSDSFYNLLQSCPPALSIQKFLPYFDQITRARISKITAFLPEKGKESCPEISRENSEALLANLRANCRPLTLRKLGSIGKLEDFEAYAKANGELQLNAQKGSFSAELPILVEVFARVDGQAQHQFFVNRSPITGQADLSYQNGQLNIYGCGLAETVKVKIPEKASFWVNILTPYMPIVSNGKEPDFSGLASLVLEAVKKAAKQLKSRPKVESDTLLAASKSLPSQKAVVQNYLAKAIAKASGEGAYRYSLRQLYYAMRPYVMRETGKELRYQNFNQIITDYEYEQGEDLPGIYRDERGTLLHPHTQQQIRLGTKSVESYHRPSFQFNKILYAEKEGFFEVLKDTGFCERYDCALLTSKGFASRAARDVIDLLAETEEALTFFCIHDADLSGTLIYQALQGATKARPERKVEIINLGLEPWEGLAMGLEVERLPKRLSKQAATYVRSFDQNWQSPQPADFEGYERWADWQEWLRFFRIELNAMSSPQFVEWLEQKIAPYHQGKVVPNEAHLQDRANQQSVALLQATIREELLKDFALEAKIQERLAQVLPQIESKISQAELTQQVQAHLAENTEQSWQEALQIVLQRLI